MMTTDIGIRITLKMPFEQAIQKTTDALVVTAVDLLLMLGALQEDSIMNEVARVVAF